MKSKEIKYKYFSCVEGCLIPRYGSSGQYIGAKLVPSGQESAKSMAGPSAEGSFKWVFDPDHIERIPENSFIYYLREYNRVLKGKQLRERTQAEWNKTKEEVSEKIEASPAKKGK